MARWVQARFRDRIAIARGQRLAACGSRSWGRGARKLSGTGRERAAVELPVNAQHSTDFSVVTTPSLPIVLRSLHPTADLARATNCFTFRKSFVWLPSSLSVFVFES